MDIDLRREILNFLEPVRIVDDHNLGIVTLNL